MVKGGGVYIVPTWKVGQNDRDEYSRQSRHKTQALQRAHNCKQNIYPSLRLATLAQNT